VHELVHAVSVGRGPASRGLKSTLKALTPQGPRRRALGAVRSRLLYSAPPLLDEQLMAQLRARFKSEVEALSDYLGRDLVALWGYDRPR
jgi:hypothetical protein